MLAVLRSREWWLAGVIIILIGLVSTRYSGFSSPASLLNVFNDTSLLVMLALAQMVVIVTGAIDLSIAANLAVCGMFSALLNAYLPDLPIVLIILAAIVFGICLGGFNGILVWRLGIPPIVVTLGTLTIYRGMIYIIAGGAWVTSQQMSDTYKAFPRVELLSVPVLSWFAVVAIIVFAYLMKWTPLGRAFYASGINLIAASYAGIDVGKMQFIAFCIAGAVAGLAGYLWVARYTVAYVDIARGFELSIIAACVIGGVSIIGGRGSVAGTVLGALFLGVINNALPVIHVSPFWQLAISGAAILLAVTLNSATSRPTRRVILRGELEHDAV